MGSHFLYRKRLAVALVIYGVVMPQLLSVGKNPPPPSGVGYRRKAFFVDNQRKGLGTSVKQDVTGEKQ
jgi:hypothetical protein